MPNTPESNKSRQLYQLLFRVLFACFYFFKINVLYRLIQLNNETSDHSMVTLAFANQWLFETCYSWFVKHWSWFVNIREVTLAE